ncbi:MAG TPA: hypothetical protein VGU02_09075 [Gaiellaceae bacterium]|nr:hypothetical protein [Gaiellaceae bacterium]
MSHSFWVIQEVLRRAAESWLLIGVLGALFVAGFAGSTFAYFDATTGLTATFSGGTVAATTSQTATASGYDGVVTWSMPSTVGVQGQRILVKDNASSTDCSAVAYTSTVASGLPPTATTYTDSNRTATTGNGDQFCYAVESYWTTNSWYQTARAAATQLGLVVDSVVLHNGGTSGTLDSGDTVTLTFNQPPATPANGTFCTFHTGGIVLIGDSTCSTTSDTFVIAKLSGYAVGGVGHQKRTGTVSVSGNVMTVTVTQNGQTFSGSGSFTPSGSLKSVATSDQATVCTSCAPTASGSF